jgi:transcriptional regulator with XRE-family HTH domain
MARLNGVTASAVAQWEHPRGTRPSIERLQGIATATRVSVAWLLSGGAMRPDKRAQYTEGEQAAVDIGVFAESLLEETLIKHFRLMRPKAQEHFAALATEMITSRRRPRLQRH